VLRGWVGFAPLAVVQPERIIYGKRT